MNIKFVSFLLFLCTALSLSISAQNVQGTFVVKGILVDSLTQKGEPYATIRIFTSKNLTKPAHMAVTDGNGNFRVDLKEPNNYMIAFSAVGKNVVSRIFGLSEQNKVIDLGKVLMTESAEMLKSVEVVAQKPLIKAEIDRLIYNIEDDPDSKFSTVLEMLRKVPLMTVDGGDNIQLKGSRDFKVFVNGKPNNMMSKNPKDVFRSMPANSIKSIEVITDPGAKYDAEGIGGILNIVTAEKRNFEGYTATVSMGVTNSDVNGNVNATVKLGKFMLMGNYSRTHIDAPRSYTENGREDYTSDEYKYLSVKSSRKNKAEMQRGSVDASYEFDKSNLISFSLNMSGYAREGDNKGTTRMLNAKFLPAYSYNTINNTDDDNKNIDASLDYQHSFKKKGEYLTFSYLYSGNPELSETSTEYDEVKDYPYSVDDLSNQYFDNDSRTDEHTFQVDYTTPINKMHDIAVGAKLILRENTSKTKYYKEKEGVLQLDEALSDNYKRNHRILASYAEYKMKWKQWGARAGVRYEHSFMDVKYNQFVGKDFSKDFDDVVPSVIFSYQLSPAQMLRASYNMRISRPSIWFLNPFCDTSDPTHISYGNPNLDTEKAHRLSLSYSMFASKFNVEASLNYSFMDNGIEQYSFINNGIMETTFGNIAKSKRTYLSLWMNWTPWRRTRITLNGSGEYVDYQSSQPSLKMSNNGFSGSLLLNVQQALPWKLRLSLNGYASSPIVSLQGEGMAIYSYGLRLSRAFLKENRLQVSVNATSLFHEYMTIEEKIYDSNFYSWSKNKVPQRVVGVNVSWRFGQLKASVKKTERSILNDDVKEGESDN